MSYRNLIENNQLLAKHWKEENYLYIPLYKLANKVQEKVVQFMDYEYDPNNGYGFINDPDKYVPLEKKDKVSQECRNFLIYLLTDKNPKKYPFMNDSNRACYHFWHGARKGKFRDIPPDKQFQFPTIEFLDKVSELVGYKSFNYFIRKFFSASEKIRIILLPFWEPFSHEPIVTDLLEYELNLLQKGSLLNLEIIKQPSQNEGKIGWEYAKEIGSNFHSDLVIWGRLDHTNQIHLSCYALKPEISYFWNTNLYRPDSFPLENIRNDFLTSLKSILYWSTAIRLSLRKDNRTSIKIFRKLLHNNFQLMEVNLCLSILYNFKKLDTYVNHHVAVTIALATNKTLKKTKELMNSEESINLKNGSIIRQLIKKWNISIERKMKNNDIEKMKPRRFILFEYIGATILLTYKNLFSPEQYERMLKNLIDHTHKIDVKSEYSKVFASIYFEMGIIEEKKLNNNTNIGPEDVYDLYYIAVLHSDEKRIHNTCKIFFQKHKLFGGIKKEINKRSKHSAEILSLYK